MIWLKSFTHHKKPDFLWKKCTIISATRNLDLKEKRLCISKIHKSMTEYFGVVKVYVIR